MQPSRGRRITFGVVTIGLAWLSVEILARLVLIGLGVTGWSYGPYYRNDPELRLLTWTQDYGPHPFFGQESRAIREFEAARGREPDVYRIGILGGSVAESWARHAISHPEALEGLRKPLELGPRRIQVVNLAMGAARQPQTFAIANFFLEDIELFVDLGGFNDTEPGHLLPLYPLEVPNFALRYSERAAGGAVYRALGNGQLHLYQALTTLPKHVPGLSRSAAYFAFWSGAGKALVRGIRSCEARYYAAAVRPEVIAPAELLERRLVIWERYTRRMHALVAAEGKRVFSFVQPNQYLQGSKPLSTWEQTSAIDPAQVRYGHRRMARLVERAQKLGAEGLHVIDLSGVYQNTRETVYKDHCCHLNDRGNEILTQAIVSAIAGAVWAEQEDHQFR